MLTLSYDNKNRAVNLSVPQGYFGALARGAVEIGMELFAAAGLDGALSSFLGVQPEPRMIRQPVTTGDVMAVFEAAGKRWIGFMELVKALPGGTGIQLNEVTSIIGHLEKLHAVGRLECVKLVAYKDGHGEYVDVRYGLPGTPPLPGSVRVTTEAPASAPAAPAACPASAASVTDAELIAAATAAPDQTFADIAKRLGVEVSPAAGIKLTDRLAALASAGKISQSTKQAQMGRTRMRVNVFGPVIRPAKAGAKGAKTQSKATAKAPAPAVKGTATMPKPKAKPAVTKSLSAQREKAQKMAEVETKIVTAIGKLKTTGSYWSIADLMAVCDLGTMTDGQKRASLIHGVERLIQQKRVVRNTTRTEPMTYRLCSPPAAQPASAPN